MGVWRHKRLLVVFPWPLYSVEEWGTQRDPLPCLDSWGSMEVAGVEKVWINLGQRDLSETSRQKRETLWRRFGGLTGETDVTD